jgi:hypothetical protein
MTSLFRLSKQEEVSSAQALMLRLPDHKTGKHFVDVFARLVLHAIFTGEELASRR